MRSQSLKGLPSRHFVGRTWSMEQHLRSYKDRVWHRTQLMPLRRAPCPLRSAHPFARPEVKDMIPGGDFHPFVSSSATHKAGRTRGQTGRGRRRSTWDLK